MWFQKIINKWKSKKEGSIYKYTTIKKVQSFSEIPKVVGSTIYLVGSVQSNKWVVLKCPCGDSGRIEVNLMKSCYPNWRLKIKEKNISLWPSIVANHNGHTCHFWLKGNKVEWSWY
jgi:hypothetical protein